jgi:hypothetical protein
MRITHVTMKCQACGALQNGPISERIVDGSSRLVLSAEECQLCQSFDWVVSMGKPEGEYTCLVSWLSSLGPLAE